MSILIPNEISAHNFLRAKSLQYITLMITFQDPLEEFDLFVSRPIVQSINDLSTNDTSTASMEVESSSSTTQSSDDSTESLKQSESEKNEGESSLVKNNNLFNVNASDNATNSEITTNQIFTVNIPFLNNLLTTTTKPKTTTTTELAFVIYGLYPNGTIVRKYPNGTIIPETTNITENSPDDEIILNDIISRNTIFRAVNIANNGMPFSTSTTTPTTSAVHTTASSIQSTALPSQVSKLLLN